MSSIPSLAELAPDALLTEDEAADYLRIRPSALKTMRLRGRGPAYVRVGRSVRFTCGAIRLFLDTAAGVPASNARAGSLMGDLSDGGTPRASLAVAEVRRFAA